MYIVSGYADGCRQAAGGNVMLLATFCWESTGPAIHVAVTLTCTTHQNIFANQAHAPQKHSLTALTSLAGHCALPNCQKELWTSLSNITKRLGVDLASKFHRSQ